MAQTNATIAVTRVDLESDHPSKGVLYLRFKSDGFEAAAALLEIAYAHKVQWSADSGYTERLIQAATMQQWSDDRVFWMEQWLREDPRILELFLDKVLPQLEVSFVGMANGMYDPRLYS